MGAPNELTEWAAAQGIQLPGGQTIRKQKEKKKDESGNSMLDFPSLEARGLKPMASVSGAGEQAENAVAEIPGPPPGQGVGDKINNLVSDIQRGLFGSNMAWNYAGDQYAGGPGGGGGGALSRSLDLKSYDPKTGKAPGGGMFGTTNPRTSQFEILGRNPETGELVFPSDFEAGIDTQPMSDPTDRTFKISETEEGYFDPTTGNWYVRTWAVNEETGEGEPEEYWRKWGEGKEKYGDNPLNSPWFTQNEEGQLEVIPEARERVIGEEAGGGGEGELPPDIDPIYQDADAWTAELAKRAGYPSRAELEAWAKRRQSDSEPLREDDPRFWWSELAGRLGIWA